MSIDIIPSAFRTEAINSLPPFRLHFLLQFALSQLCERCKAFRIVYR